MPAFFNDFLQQFHFLRPLWLLVFVPLLLLLMWSWRQHKNSQSWLNVIDKKLQPFVLTHADEDRHAMVRWLPVSALIIAVIALAGPVWQQLPQSVYKPQSALVIALDMSRSMDAADVKPSRLTRAKIKIIDLLNARTEGQVALIAYAAESFTVSPLTDDSDTVEALLKSLTTDIMPAQGSRMDKAIERANDLLRQAGIAQGHILIVSDGVSDLELNEIKKADKSPHSISILAVGTEQGAPIATAQGGFLKDSKGQIVIVQMNRTGLLSVAQSHQGVFATLRNDDEDINALLNLMRLNRLDGNNTLSNKTFDVWYEHGSWLLLLVVPMALMAFRKGLLLLAVVIILPMPQQAQAIDWQSWFKNSDQKAAEQFKAGEFEAAQKQFKQQDWRAAAQYKDEQFESALQHFEQSNDLYNKGNALAKTEQYEEAIKVWDELLKQNPKHQDAAYNKKQVEDFIKQQEQQQQDKKQDEQSQDQENKDQENKDQESKEQQQSEQQDSSQQEQSDSDQKQDEQQSSEQEQSEQQKEPQSAEQQQEKSEQEQQEQEEKAKQQQADEQQQEKTEQQLAAEQELKEQMQDPLDEETKQWLRRIPDDPGGLMRNKFLYQYRQLNRQNNEQNPW